MSDGQFDWGGRLLKGNGGAQRFPRMVGNHSKSVKAEGSLTARPTSRAGTKVGLSDPVVPHGRYRSTDKATLGITGLSPQESTSTGRFGTSMSARRILGCSRSQGWAVRPLKRHASWVQNVVRQFGPYPSRALEI